MRRRAVGRTSVEGAAGAQAVMGVDSLLDGEQAGGVFGVPESQHFAGSGRRSAKVQLGFFDARRRVLDDPVDMGAGRCGV